MQCFACLSNKATANNVSKNTESQGKSPKSSNLLHYTEKAIRILLLGPGSSGKTTILKQIKKIHDCEDERDRRQTAKYIKDAVVSNMQILCEQSVLLNATHDLNTLVDVNNEHLRSELCDLRSPYLLTQQLAYKIRILWSDSGIQNTLNYRQYFQIPENASHFFDNIDSVASATYCPSFDDYLRFRQVTTGLSQTKIKINFGNSFGDQMFEFTDVGGQRSERNKMRYASDEAQAVIYVVGISDYDLTLYEDNTTNRLKESIELFRDIMINKKLYEDKTVILFFNKYDLFQEKIKKVPITVAFDDFPDTLNANHDADVIRFVAQKFLQVFKDAKAALSGPLHIMRTTALDTDMIDKIFSGITLDLVKRNLEHMDLL